MSLVEKIQQARAHVLDGGVIEWEETDTAGVPVVAQRRKTPGCDGQHQKRYLPPYHDNEWQDMDGGFLEFRDEDNDIQEEIRAVESVRVLPKPAKVSNRINADAPNITGDQIPLPHRRRSDIPAEIEGPVLVRAKLIAKRFQGSDSARRRHKPAGR